MWRSALLLLACRTVAPEVPALAPVPEPKAELWVDGSAPEGGDGTPSRPFRALTLREKTVVHLATGLYPVTGPLPAGVELHGGRAVVLVVEGELLAADARLQSVLVQGGRLKVTGTAMLEDVGFSGQRELAVLVEGTLDMRRGEIEGTVSETRGVVVQGKAFIDGTRFKGALRRAIAVEGGDATVANVSSEGPVTLLHQGGGRATVRGARAVAGRGPAFFVAGGALELRDVEVVGHEFALLSGTGAVVKADGLKSARAIQGAVSLLGSEATLQRVVIVQPGPQGGLLSLEGTTTVEDLQISEATDGAVLVRHGKLTARRVRITNVRGSGDGIMVRDAVARLDDIKVTDALGSGVVATAVATVELDGLHCEGCRHGALVVERRSTVRAKNVKCDGCREAAVTVPDDGSLELDGLEVTGEGPGVWAECAAGSRVVLKGKLPRRELLSGRCIEFPNASSK